MEPEQDDLNCDIAREVLKKRILLADAAGSPLETPEEMFSRVAWHVAATERRSTPSSRVREAAEAFCRMMEDLNFLPNSPTLVNAGFP